MSVMQKGGYQWRLLSQKKVTNQSLPFARKHAFRMKLNAFYWEVTMTKSHDHGSTIAVVSTGADFQFFRQAVLFHDQRVVARRCHRGRNVAKDCTAIVLDLACFPVHETVSANDFAAESRANSLMSKTDTKNGNLAGKVANDRDALSGFLRRARPW